MWTKQQDKCFNFCITYRAMTSLLFITDRSSEVLLLLFSVFNIRITCPCNEHPLTPHFYIEKVGFTRVYIFFLFLLQNIDCGYSLEPPR